MITSKTNSVIKYISSLKNKKYRNMYNKYIVEGVKMVKEIINSEGIAPEFIIYSTEILSMTTIGLDFLQSLKASKILELANVIEVSKPAFEYICDTETPQGVMCIMPKEDIGLEELKIDFKKNNKCKYIILDKIQDSRKYWDYFEKCSSIWHKKYNMH